MEKLKSAWNWINKGPGFKYIVLPVIIIVIIVNVGKDFLAISGAKLDETKCDSELVVNLVMEGAYDIPAFEMIMGNKASAIKDLANIEEVLYQPTSKTRYCKAIYVIEALGSYEVEYRVEDLADTIRVTPELTDKAIEDLWQNFGRAAGRRF